MRDTQWPGKNYLRGKGTTAALRESPNPEDCGRQTWEESDPCKPANCDNSAKRGFFPHTICPLQRVSQKQITSPFTKTTVKKTKTADARQQRKERVTITTGFIPQQIKAMTCD